MNKYLEIINFYGINHQLKKLSEEVFELQEAILQKHDIEHITEEFADVQVLLEQIRLMYGISHENVEIIKKFKVERQLKRMKK